MTSFLKKIGLANSDGTPSEIYRKFRNAATTGAAAAEALDFGYAALRRHNEYWRDLPDDKLRGLIIETTGQSADSNVVSLIMACIKGIKKFAKQPPKESVDAPTFHPPTVNEMESNERHTQKVKSMTGLGMNLSYTINLNLPATSDPAVFNAIFKSLKENLLEVPNDEG